MKIHWFVVFAVVLMIAGLYLVEISKIPTGVRSNLATLDDLEETETAAAWEPFYHVRATLIDGQSAQLTVPNELRSREGQEMELTGATVFFGNGSERKGDTVTISQFYLLPSLGLAQACEIQPDIEMRWTILVQLKEKWILHRDDMIDAMTTVKGIFRIDASNPYDGCFFLDNAAAELAAGNESME